MASQTGQQIIAIHILPNIARSKTNQAMKFYHLIEYIIWKIFFFKNYKEKEAKRLIPDLLVFKKSWSHKSNCSVL